MSKKQQKEWKDMSKAEKIASLIVLAIFAFIIVSIISAISRSDSGNEHNADKPTYEATVNDTKVLDPATLVVSVGVQNTNNTKGKPSCFIETKSANGTYRGYGSFIMNDTIPAGEKRGLIANLTVTKEGAVYVTEVTADCEV